MPPSGMLRRVILVITDVSEEGKGQYKEELIRYQNF
jgi:hypothetical protein